MKYYWKVFLWENGHKSTDFSDHLLVPLYNTDRLNEVLDVGQIVLDDMPISSKKAFPPKTKFRLERYKTKNLEDEPLIIDMLVEHDDVDEYVGNPDICCHRIYLQESSVVAQGMHTDNFSLTYELQDVNLNYKTIKEDPTNLDKYIQPVPGGYATALRQTDNVGYSESGEYRYFRNSYKYSWDEESLKSLKSLKLNSSASQSNSISFNIPKLICQGCYSAGTWSNLFEVNTITRVYEIKTLRGQQVSKTLIVEKECGPTSINKADDAVYYSDGTVAKLRAINDWTDKGDIYVNQFDREWTTHPTLATAKSEYSDRTVTFMTTQLEDSELIEGYSLTYAISCMANPTNQNGMLINYEKQFYGLSFMAPFWDGYQINYIVTLNGTCTTTKNEIIEASTVVVPTSLYCKDMSEDAEGGPFLMKGVKYSCFDLLRKALLTVDTQILDNSELGIDSVVDENLNEIGIQYPIIVSQDWNNRLKTMKVQETMFECKNLWEVLLQIGYYLHAVPYLEFAEDGTDRFVLKFKQLGDTKVKNNNSSKLTIFNSRNLAEYYSQYDSYVTNMFSPQNIIDEWLVVKTASDNYLISNNTAQLQVSFPLMEIIEFDISYDGSAGGTAGTKSALQYIFEESVYQILTSDNPVRICPAKGNSLFFSLGGTTIDGLNYVPPSVNNDAKMSLKEICRRLFGTGENYFEQGKLKFNSLKFHIKYRTQDNLRVSQVRPDIQNFMKNSSYEKYPHHEQWFGQQDKIIDSERFSANLFGKLVRVGNSVYQCQEYAEIGNEKESGDLVLIDNEPYYVTEVENEFYPDAILQKVTYSKNFNQLSNIVTIPSEPRFYEISERSKIRREIRMMEFFELTTKKPESTHAPRFLNKDTWKEFIKTIIFNTNTVKIPNFAYTKFRTDYKRVHTGSYGQYVENSKMFPSGEVDRTDPNNITPVESKDYADCIVPLLHFPLHDGIVFEWNMEDNFKAGDYVDESLGGGSANDDAYLTLQPLRYVDIMGRADLFTFRLFNKSDWSFQETQKLPKASIIPLEKDCQVYLPDPLLIGLDKDCREELSFNYQINFLHRAQKDDDDFITFPNLFGTKDSELKMCLLDEPQSMFNENINLSAANIVADNVEYELNCNDGEFIEIKITQPDVNLDRVKSIVLYQQDEIGSRAAYIVKNVHNLDNDEKLGSWWIYPVYNS
ncbi:MAG: hypothetical protein IJX17_00160 [Clostridia bacterium]|nr:hypothetical protein [Clostridia bacterium]